MAKSRIVQVKDFDVHLEELLAGYHRGINNGIEDACAWAVEELAKKTKATAPKGKRGTFRKSIAHGLRRKNRWSSVYVWYVKPPNHRLTHLLVHGHATKDGGRTHPNPFLKNALDEVLPRFETRVQSVFDYYNDINNVDGKYHTRGMGD